jgi:hypothetical protein
MFVHLYVINGDPTSQLLPRIGNSHSHDANI